eukprot:403334881
MYDSCSQCNNFFNLTTRRPITIDEFGCTWCLECVNIPDRQSNKIDPLPTRQYKLLCLKHCKKTDFQLENLRSQISSQYSAINIKGRLRHYIVRLARYLFAHTVNLLLITSTPLLISNDPTSVCIETMFQGCLMSTLWRT